MVSRDRDAMVFLSLGSAAAPAETDCWRCLLRQVGQGGSSDNSRTRKWALCKVHGTRQDCGRIWTPEFLLSSRFLWGRKICFCQSITFHPAASLGETKLFMPQGRHTSKPIAKLPCSVWKRKPLLLFSLYKGEKLSVQATRRYYHVLCTGIHSLVVQVWKGPAKITWNCVEIMYWKLIVADGVDGLRLGSVWWWLRSIYNDEQRWASKEATKQQKRTITLSCPRPAGMEGHGTAADKRNKCRNDLCLVSPYPVGLVSVA